MWVKRSKGAALGEGTLPLQALQSKFNDVACQDYLEFVNITARLRSWQCASLVPVRAPTATASPYPTAHPLS